MKKKELVFLEAAMATLEAMYKEYEKDMNRSFEALLSLTKKKRKKRIIKIKTGNCTR